MYVTLSSRGFADAILNIIFFIPSCFKRFVQNLQGFWSESLARSTYLPVPSRSLHLARSRHASPGLTLRSGVLFFQREKLQCCGVRAAVSLYTRGKIPYWKKKKKKRLIAGYTWSHTSASGVPFLTQVSGSEEDRRELIMRSLFLFLNLHDFITQTEK